MRTNLLLDARQLLFVVVATVLALQEQPAMYTIASQY